MKKKLACEIGDDAILLHKLSLLNLEIFKILSSTSTLISFIILYIYTPRAHARE